MDERGRVALLGRVLGRGRAAIGIGDDAAVLSLPHDGSELACSVDAVVEGTHFRRGWLSFRELGFKATMAAASDLAAMGAVPAGVLASLVLPGDVSDADLEALAQGQAEACDALGTEVAGGNLARGDSLAITTTVLGFVERPLRRDGARPGDRLWLAGTLGLARAGLELLLGERAEEGGAAAAALAAWRRPTARIHAGRRVRASASAGIDVSDGLSLDADRLAEASGVRVVLDGAALVSPELAAAAAHLGRSALELALHGGEDYALLVTLPPGASAQGFLPIGRVEPGGAPRVLLEQGGALEPVSAGGFDHFRG